MSEKTHLLPCPFCGGEPTFEGNGECWKDEYSYVEMSLECCISMTAQMGQSQARGLTPQAIEAQLREKLTRCWNARSEMAVIPAGFALLPEQPSEEFIKRVENHGVWKGEEVRSLYSAIVNPTGAETVNAEAQAAQIGHERSDRWVRCPVCGESDMEKTYVDEKPLIRCVNHACASNGGNNADALLGSLKTPSNTASTHKGWKLVPVQPSADFIKRVEGCGAWGENEVRNLYADIIAAVSSKQTLLQEPAGYRISCPREPDLGTWLSEEPGGPGCLNESLWTLAALEAQATSAPKDLPPADLVRDETPSYYKAEQRTVRYWNEESVRSMLAARTK